MISKYATIGSNVRLGNNVTIYANVIIEDNCVLFDNVQIGFPNNNSIETTNTELIDCPINKTIVRSGSIIRSGSVVYEGVQLGRNSDITHYVIIRSGTIIGANSLIYPHSVIHENVIVGDFLRLNGIICSRAKIGNNVTIMGKLIHKFDRFRISNIEPSPTIEDHSVIGYDALIIGDVIVKQGSFIKALSVIK